MGSVLFMVALFHFGTCQEANEQQVSSPAVNVAFVIAAL